jgi:predicted RNA-binding Zn-ribbon protein involved in translation (DUF1610 family)
MKMPKEMCSYITPYRCSKCGEDVLFFVTSNNHLIDYKAMIDNRKSIYQLKEYLAEKRVKFVKCLACGQTYIIDWSNGYPVQLLDKNILKQFGV